MEKLVFAVSLADQVTGPAKRMQKSLLDESKALIEVNRDAALLEKEVQRLERAMVKSAASMDFKAWAKQDDLLRANREALSKLDTAGLRRAESLKAQAAAVMIDAKAQLVASKNAALLNKNVEAQALAAEEAAASFRAYVGSVALAGAALGAAAGAVVLAGAKFTLEAVQEKQAAQNMFRAMAGGKEAGDQLFDMMENLSKELPQTKDKLTAWSKEFTAMGVLDQSALQNQLRATASAAALMGDSGAEAFTSLSRKIQEAMLSTGKIKLGEKQLAGFAAMGVNVADVADAMNMSVKDLSEGLKKGTVDATKFNDALTGALIEKGAGPLGKMFGKMETIIAKFKEAIGDMFEDVDIEPFVGAMRSLLEIFDQSTTTGQMLKSVFSGFFTSFFVWTGKAITSAKHFFLDMIILGLKAYIAVKPWIPLLKTLGMVIAVAGGLFLLTFAPAVWAGVVALGALIASAAVAAAPFLAMAAVIVGVYEAFTHWEDIKVYVAGWVKDLGTMLFDLADSFTSWAATATENLINGLVNGISNGAQWVYDSISNLAKGAMAAFKKTLGIASDSKEFIKLGGFTASGYTRGLVAANDNVSDAASGLAESAMAGASKADAPVSPAVSASVPGLTVNIAPGAIVINGADGSAAELTEHALTLILEKVALAQGLAA